MKTKMGRGGRLNNEKNMSAIRCEDDTYQNAYPKIVKARYHKPLALGSTDEISIAEPDMISIATINSKKEKKPGRNNKRL